jgi:hypothetical protein
MHMHPRSREDNFLNNLRPVPVVVVQQEIVDRVGFEPTTSANFLRDDYYNLKGIVVERELFRSHSLHFEFPRVVLCLMSRKIYASSLTLIPFLHLLQAQS